MQRTIPSLPGQRPPSLPVEGWPLAQPREGNWRLWPSVSVVTSAGKSWVWVMVLSPRHVIDCHYWNWRWLTMGTTLHCHWQATPSLHESQRKDAKRIVPLASAWMNDDALQSKDFEFSSSAWSLLSPYFGNFNFSPTPHQTESSGIFPEYSGILRRMVDQGNHRTGAPNVLGPDLFEVWDGIPFLRQPERNHKHREITNLLDRRHIAMWSVSSGHTWFIDSAKTPSCGMGSITNTNLDVLQPSVPCQPYSLHFISSCIGPSHLLKSQWQLGQRFQQVFFTDWTVTPLA